ncbi:MAG TPA: apolipoprotein N-acyltransferase [Terracidiphilus sp.]|nr:apolipoprotein N-acyltransferase [Terracidiphilus sp.]
MQRPFVASGSWKLWAAAGLSAGLLELPFPLAGPLPVWRSLFAWFGLVPLLCAILSAAKTGRPRPLRRAFLLSYVCGVLWYIGNCYWIRDTMMQYGDMPALAPTLLLIGYSLVLGLYVGLFGFAVALLRKATGSIGLALAAAPVFWAGLELAASRITSVPWDQLGYSQVDNTLVNQLAPWTGVYGISFLLVTVNALIAAGLVLDRCSRQRLCGIIGVALALAGTAGIFLKPPRPAATATAVLIQPNLDVSGSSLWMGPGEWDSHIADFSKLAAEQCKTYIVGIPQTGAPSGEIVCPPYPTHPDLIAWPESPAPFFEDDARFQKALVGIARTAQAPLVVGNIGMTFSTESAGWLEYNSALVVSPDGARVGRYDKIHLVPFGEYVPFSRLLFFARKLTGKVSKFTPGDERKVFRLNGHRYGVFICYEAVFADEVRHFAQLGAEVLVNISDDGWYGDTSAPWQHLNMARMRAIENRRWILRDTNNGVTAAIDPYGRVRQSIPRHRQDALPAGYGFRDDVTFYTAHGDVFAWLCAILGLGIVAWAARKILGQVVAAAKVQNKVRS